MNVIKPWDKDEIISTWNLISEQDISKAKKDTDSLLALNNEKEEQKNVQINQANTLLQQLEDKPQNIEKLKDMRVFYEKIDKKLFDIEYTCLPGYEEHHKWADRRAYMQTRMQDLMNMYDTEGNWNFLQDKELAESIWMKNQIRWTFRYGLDHLSDTYNDKEIDENDKLYQMRATVAFLKSLLARNVNL